MNHLKFTDHQSVISWLELELTSKPELVWNKLSSHLQKKYKQELLASAYRILDDRLVAHLYLSDEEYESNWKEVVDYVEVLWHSFTIESVESEKWLYGS